MEAPPPPSSAGERELRLEDYSLVLLAEAPSKKSSSSSSSSGSASSSSSGARSEARSTLSSSHDAKSANGTNAEGIRTLPPPTLDLDLEAGTRGAFNAPPPLEKTGDVGRPAEVGVSAVPVRPPHKRLAPKQGSESIWGSTSSLIAESRKLAKEALLSLMTNKKVVRGRNVLSSWMYIIGSVLYLVASFFIIPELNLSYDACVYQYIAGSVLFFAAALMDMIAVASNFQLKQAARRERRASQAHFGEGIHGDGSFMSGGGGGNHLQHYQQRQDGGATRSERDLAAVDKLASNYNLTYAFASSMRLGVAVEEGKQTSFASSSSRLETGPILLPPARKFRPFRMDTEKEMLVSGVIYLVGGTLFLIGSLLFWPLLGFPPKSGTYTFRAGSCVYIIGGIYGLVQLMWNPIAPKTSSGGEGGGRTATYGYGCGRYRTDRLSKAAKLWILAKLQFVCGSSLFITGGVRFQFDSYTDGGWIWVVGSFLFTFGSATGLLALYV